MVVTKTVVRKARIGNKHGWAFEVYYGGHKYPGIISSLVKTEIGAKRNLTKFLKTGKLSTFGNAE